MTQTLAPTPVVADRRTPTAPPSAPSRGGSYRVPAQVYRVIRVLSPLMAVALWQVASSTGLLPERILASPAALLETTRTLTESGELQEAVLVSLRRATVGFLLGAAFAVVLGGIVGLSRLGDALIDPLFQMLRMLPLFGLVPLFIIWFGIKEEPKIYLVALFVVVPLYLNLVAALRGVDKDLREVADSLRLNTVERWRHLYVPAVTPGVLVGVRQALGMAWIALIVAEQVNAGAGLGYLINNARDFLRTDVIVVGLLCYAVLGLVTDSAVRLLERRALRWRGDAA
ncbi:ABC transporter permease [Nocardioides jishulii]|uniref:ABC transporter permease n=1 Tax=Nocardioides jishulii TaxID=2575440 RepID=A0A4V5TKR8_9ACTN|nr:ABC transporter permease [Nocardioides jishulii]QCX28314.1 ABC transporter permease [Nocardioides jishulii]TKI64793.1 ABC transporter permease [Nocardioides jishulii]